jgi:hypothetical protein
MPSSSLRLGRHGRLSAQGVLPLATLDYPGQRLTLSCGDARIGLDLSNAGFDDLRWYDALELPCPGFADVRVIEAGDLTAAGDRDDEQAQEARKWGLTVSIGQGITLSGIAGDVVVDAEGCCTQFHVNRGSSYAETAGNLRTLAFSWLLAACVGRGAVVMHAGSFMRGTDAWLVAGPSHAGKSTLLSRVGDAFLNEEYGIAFKDSDGAWWSWWFPHARGPYEQRPSASPLLGVAILSPHRSSTTARRIGAADAFARLSELTSRIDATIDETVLDRLEELVDEVPTVELAHCLAEPIERVFEALDACRSDGV